MENQTAASALPNALLRLLPVTALCVALASCGGGGGAPVVASDNTASARDLSIAQTVYRGEQRVPTGFYTEPRLYPDRSEFRFHVSNTDIGLAPQAPMRFEVCNDDFVAALQWSADSASARQFQSSLAATSESDWYFEFQRDVASDDPAMLINRVFKCSALNRAGLTADGFAGQITRTPLTAEDLRYISEYLWQFSIYNNALNAVLASDGGDDADALIHDLQRAEVLVGQGASAGCDRVELWTWRHRADPLDGRLVSEQIFERSFDARQQNGAVSLCN